MQEIKIKPVLWRHKTAKNGEFEIRIRVTQYKVVGYYNTGFTSREENWDELNECPRTSHPKFKAIIKKINSLVSEIDYEIKTMHRNGIEMISLKELKDKVRKVELRVQPVKILQLFDIVIKEMEEQGRIGYAGVFYSGKIKLKKYLLVDKTFWAFTKTDFEAYENYLRTNVPSENTMSLYIRTFNRLWNIAIQRGYCTDGLKQRNALYPQM